MRCRGVANRRLRRCLVLIVLAACALAGCTYNPQEPGLFGRETAPPTAAPASVSETPTETPPPGNRELPVVGEAVWTSGDGLDITVRLAVHAVRRMPHATVLDWSVTPLSGPNLGANDAVPSSLNLGLSRFGEGNTNVFLLDSHARRLYRPLTHRGPGLQSCLCTPVWLVQRELRIGHTTLLQTAYPPLPDDVFTLDVDIATVPIFSRVPVTPAGMVPVVGNATDLTRPVDRAAAAASTPVFTYRPGHQRFIITIDTVYVSSSFTSILWSIQSVDGGSGLEAADRPPFADDRPPPLAYNPVSASGPQVLANGGDEPPVRARLATTKLAGRGAWNASVPISGCGRPPCAALISGCRSSPTCRPSRWARRRWTSCCPGSRPWPTSASPPLPIPPSDPPVGSRCRRATGRFGRARRTQVGTVPRGRRRCRSRTN